MAIDMFFDTSVVAAAASATSASVAPVSVASADGDGAEVVGPAKESIAETVNRLPRRPWTIPAVVERGFEIPIGITDTDAIPELGDFRWSREAFY